MKWDQLWKMVIRGVIAAGVIYGGSSFFEISTKDALLVYVVLGIAYVYLDSKFSRLERIAKGALGDLDDDPLVERINRSLDEKLGNLYEATVKKFEETFDPTANRVADLVWMYKKDNPRPDEENS